MDQLLVILLLFSTGYIFLDLYKSNLSPLLKFSLALPLGSSLSIISFVVHLILKVPISNISLILGNCIILLFQAGRLGFNRIYVMNFLLSAIFMMLISSCALFFNLSIFSYDSFIIQNLAHQISDHSGIIDYSGLQLSSWGVFLVGLHSIAAIFNVEYFWILQPMLAVSFILLFFCITRELFKIVLGLSSTLSNTAVAVFSASLFTSYFMIFQFFYIHNSFISALYLFIGVCLFFLYEVKSQRYFIELSLISFISFGLLRTEGPLMGGLFLIVLFSSSRIESYIKRMYSIVYAIFFIIWYLKLLSLIEEGSDILTPSRAILVLIPSFFLLISCWIPFFEITNRSKWSSLLIPSSIIVVLVAFFVIESEAMVVSFKSVLENLRLKGFWGYIWWFVALGLILTFKNVYYEKVRIRLLSIILTFLGMIFIMSQFRIPYRLGWGDSANRMFTHLLPIVFLYILVSAFINKKADSEDR